MASIVIVLLMHTACMPPHNIDFTGTLGAMMFSTRGSSSSQIYCKQKRRGGASLQRLSWHRYLDIRC